jgi:hypothetical protein
MKTSNLFYILTTGALNAKEADRSLTRNEVKSVQIHQGSVSQEVPFFNTWGELGVSSFAFHPDKEHFVYGTIGSDFFEVDLNSKKVIYFELENLIDVHEITLIDRDIWLSNTGRDEVVCFNLDEKVVSKRFFLNQFRSDLKRNQDKGSLKQDKFHCNQIFKGGDGDLYCLVHHTTGIQLMKKVASKLLKTQGNGGVINLTSNKVHALNLKAPHSVRIVNDEYWVFSSGHSTINIYDFSWNKKKVMETSGWGRGAAVSKDNQFFFAGISETRKRYTNIFGKTTPNKIEIFDTKTYKSIDEVILKDIEQVNNVYLIDKIRYDLLQQLNKI